MFNQVSAQTVQFAKQYRAEQYRVAAQCKAHPGRRGWRRLTNTEGVSHAHTFSGEGVAR